MLKFYRVLLLLCVLLPLSSWALVPLPESKDDVVAEVSAAATSVPTHLSSPRETLRTFLEAMNDIKRGDSARLDDAVATLDLSEINPLVQQERGETLSWELLEVIDRTKLVDLNEVPNKTEDAVWLFESYENGAIRLRKQADGRWLFDAATVRQLPSLYAALAAQSPVADVNSNEEHLPWQIRLSRMMPATLKQEVFLLENWRWLVLLSVIALGVIADWLLTSFLRGVLKRWLRRRASDYASVADKEDRLRPLGLMAMALVWWGGIQIIGLPETGLLILLVAVKALASISAVWAAYRVVDLMAAWLLARAEKTENKLDDVLAPLIPRTLKIFVTVVGIVFIADNLNIDVTGLLAGLGLGGLAFALAAKDMVQNLFGSVTVLLDRTFSVGDWIVVEGKEGTVEHMGFRSTRLRTFYNSLVTVPNATFITAEVDNMGARRYRRYKANFGLAYDTPPDRIDAFCEGVRELVRQHPYMRKDYYHVYLNDLGDSALSVLVYVFWETPDWSVELRERHRFLLDCLRLARELDVEFAFPTQTLYLRNEEHTAPEPNEVGLAAAHQQGRDVAQRVVRDMSQADQVAGRVRFP